MMSIGVCWYTTTLPMTHQHTNTAISFTAMQYQCHNNNNYFYNYNNSYKDAAVIYFLFHFVYRKFQLMLFPVIINLNNSLILSLTILQFTDLAVLLAQVSTYLLNRLPIRQWLGHGGDDSGGRGFQRSNVVTLRRGKYV